MKVTPLDIRRKEFKRSVRGYSDEEVDLFLDEVADEFERIFQENVELHDRVRRLEEQVAGNDQLRGALEKTLVLAQLQADETRANARKESELILKDAELKARTIISDSYAEVQRVQQVLIQLKHLEEDFRFKFRSLLEGHLKLLAEAPINLAANEPVVVETSPPAGNESPFVVPEAVEEVPEYPAVTHPARADVGPKEETDADAKAAAAASAISSTAPLAAHAGAAPSIITDATPSEAHGDAAGPVSATPVVVTELPANAAMTEGETGEGDETKTVEQRSVFAEFDEAAILAGPDDNEDSTTATLKDDPLAGFFFSGGPGRTRGAGGDGDPGGKSKPRDFEW